MKEDYKLAKKKADKAVRDAIREGRSPYLPVLDTIEEVKNAKTRKSLGLMELPISRIKGNKEAGRNSAFANNFMPLFEENTEFAQKWSALYDSYKVEGIRDAIKVYEYMNQYYVQEGNKRVSVSKFGGTEYILADVTRIIPPKDDSDEIVAYYEYMDFHRVTKNFLIVFSEPGMYKKLAELLGQDLENPWPSDLCSDLRSAFFRFSKVVGKELKIENEYTLSSAFLMYLCIFPLKTFDEDSDAQILKNIRLARYELMAEGGADDVEFLNEAPEEVKQSGFLGIFSKEKKYTQTSPLKVGFVYDVDPDSSRWVDSHEAGRLYVDAMTEDNVVTGAYFAHDIGSTADALEKAVADGNEIVFATLPDMSMDVLRAAVKHPEVKFLNCCMGQSNPSIRYYHGKIHEASFLMGIYAANTYLLDYGDEEGRRIGYLSREKSAMAMSNLNAFAVGVSLIDPDCKVVVRNADEGYNNSKWSDEGIKMFADIEYPSEASTMDRPGLYRLDGGKFVHIGTSYFNWGKYYLQIVKSVLNGTWNLGDVINRHMSTNYWFGLSTGVVDIRTPNIPYQTEKLLAFMRNAITSGGLDPFTGEIRAVGGKTVKDENKSAVSIKWINENIEGSYGG
ncbi:Basic membrane lipoprotein Med, substrate-binding protein (PBP1-ABC) superfamily [Ruminococcaceae bacterium YRB3002]|nr:Basic membrane lipoprotein Med, substrate-binding protein (PBP1-ABC) superfamily [Ruminococcaceae bacterium YRB3002]